MSELARYVPREQTDSWVDVLGDVGRLSSIIARTEFVPVKLRAKPEAVAACILTGRELGLGPMTSLRSIDVIEGKPSLSTELLAARMLAAGHRIEWPQVSDRSVTVRVVRGDGLSSAEVTWTLADAERAGLARKQNWQRYPRAMLRARALAEAAQLACPDVSLGLDVVGVPEAEPSAHVQRATVQLAPAVVSEPPAESRETTGESDASDEDVESVVLDADELLSDSDDVPPAEYISDQPQPDEQLPPDSAERVNGAQMRKLNTLIGRLEKRDGRRLSREERRALILSYAGLPADAYESATQLSSAEANYALDNLEVELDASDGAIRLDGE